MTDPYDAWLTSEDDTSRVLCYCDVHETEYASRYGCPHCKDEQADRRVSERKEKR